MQRLGQIVLMVCVWAMVVTCAQITVNIYFPAAEIHDAAAKIEREVRHEDATPAETAPQASPPAGKPQSQHRWPSAWRLRFAGGIPPAMAQDININVTTPAIRQLVAARKTRFPSLMPLFDNGTVGENNRGLVEVRDLDTLSVQEKGRVKTLVQQENSNREQLYRALAEANNIAQDRVSDIGTIFAGVNRQEARPGWWIQQANGTWEHKR
jgi:uncharacterized protein YdbL (DUF1318 family)